MASYQGVLARRDVVTGLCVIWFLVTYYPMLSLGLILALLVTTFWSRTVQGARVFVQLFRNEAKDKARD